MYSQRADCCGSGGDEEAVVENFAGGPRGLDDLSRQQFNALAARLEPGSGHRIEGARGSLDLLDAIARASVYVRVLLGFQRQRACRYGIRDGRSGS